MKEVAIVAWDLAEHVVADLRVGIEGVAEPAGDLACQQVVMQGEMGAPVVKVVVATAGFDNGGGTHNPDSLSRTRTRHNLILSLRRHIYHLMHTGDD